MPYIKQEKRPKLDKIVDELILLKLSDGEINYLISDFISKYIGIGVSYTKASQLIGVLETIKLELYRRMIAPYENYKIKENGDLSIYNKWDPK